jgi:uncharacterized protein
MSAVGHPPDGCPCWTDLWTSDVDGSRRFYAELFAWEAQAPSEEFGGYFMFTREGVPVAGAMGDMGDAPANNTWKIYFATPDIDATLARAQHRGASITSPPSPVADLGVQAVLTDATRAALGAWQPRGFSGFAVTEEVAAPSWFELYARDYDVAVDFYTSVFALGASVMSDSGDFRYTTLMSGDRLVAGIMDASSLLAEGQSSYWVTYWQVDDIVAALGRVRELGGSVIDGPVDSPYGVIATVSDPTGAVFKLRSLSIP